MCDQKIWRYLPLSQFVSILQNEALWFSKIRELRDPFEGRSWSTEVTSSFLELCEAADRENFVSCWTIDDQDSALMWLAYAQNDGVAICSTTGRLKRAISCKCKPEFHDVGYFNNSAGALKMPSRCFAKRRLFEREREHRALVRSSSDDKPLKSKLVSVDLQELIVEIWISPFSEEWLQTMVKNLIFRYNLKCPVNRQPTTLDRHSLLR